MSSEVTKLLRKPGSRFTLAETMSALQADYDAANDSRFRRRRTGISPLGSHADYHYRNENDYLKMVELFRDFERNDCVISQAIGRVVDNVLQGEFPVEPNTGAAELDKILKRKFEHWSYNPEACDIAGEHDFHTLSKLTLRRVLVDGDMVNLGVNSGALQSIEAHLLRSPTGRAAKSDKAAGVVHGVQLNALRRRTTYWILREDVSADKPGTRIGDFRRIATRNSAGRRQVFHAYNPHRTSQTRGVSALAPVVDITGMHNDTQFAMLVKQQLSACFVVFRHLAHNSPLPGSSAAVGERQNETNNGIARILENVAPGLMIDGRPGEELEGFCPSIPGDGFLDHTMLLLTFIAINLGLPVAVLLLDPSNTNFSGWRGAMDQARIGFRALQRAFIERHFSPIYEWKVEEWLATDPELEPWRGRKDLNLFEHTFRAPQWNYIEPAKDATADLVRRANTLSSPRRICAERGATWEETYHETIADHAAAIRAALTEAQLINKDYPEAKLHWRELLPLPMPQGIQSAFDLLAAASAEPNQPTRSAA